MEGVQRMLQSKLERHNQHWSTFQTVQSDAREHFEKTVTLAVQGEMKSVHVLSFDSSCHYRITASGS